jgi:acyl-CoA reductase-like NAD-dependent aldehyde dehydrogenase
MKRSITASMLVGLATVSVVPLSTSSASPAAGDRMHRGIVPINDQTVDDEPAIPSGGVGASGTGSLLGAADTNIEAFTYRNPLGDDAERHRVVPLLDH